MPFTTALHFTARPDASGIRRPVRRDGEKGAMVRRIGRGWGMGRPMVRTIATSAAILLTVMAGSATAQFDLNGGWQALEHEDWIERGPGRRSRRLPGSRVQRRRGAKALSYTWAELSMLERPVPMHPHAPACNCSVLRAFASGANRSHQGTVVAWKISAAVDRDIITIWMDGRPPIRKCLLSVFGLHDRHVGR
jgi:hypothetical protein